MIRLLELSGCRSHILVVIAAAMLPAVALAEPGVEAGHRNLPTPKTTIYPGDIIAASMLSERQFATSASGAVFDKAEGLVGKIARRSLMPGQPVPIAAVREPFIVTPGRPVTLLFRQHGLTITANAIPLQPGSPGDTISVRNTESGVTVRGLVLPDGAVSAGGAP